MNGMPKVKFSFNWNRKLDCDAFTTYRDWNSRKEEHFKNLVGMKFAVLLFQKLKCYRILKKVRKTRLIDEPYELLVVDTGSSDPYGFFRKRFGITEKDPVLCLLFVKEEVEL